MHLKSLTRANSDEKSVYDHYGYDVSWDSRASNVNLEICVHIICLQVYPWRDAIILDKVLQISESCYFVLC